MNRIPWHIDAMILWQLTILYTDAETIFRLGEQKLNDCSVGEAKIVKNNQMQSITLCNMYFSKKVYAACNGVWTLGQSPRSWGIFENFCVKSNLTVCKVTFNCKLQKKLVAPPIVLLGEQLLPRFPHLWSCHLHNGVGLELWGNIHEEQTTTITSTMYEFLH